MQNSLALQPLPKVEPLVKRFRNHFGFATNVHVLEGLVTPLGGPVLSKEIKRTGWIVLVQFHELHETFNNRFRNVVVRTFLGDVAHGGHIPLHSETVPVTRPWRKNIFKKNENQPLQSFHSFWKDQRSKSRIRC